MTTYAALETCRRAGCSYRQLDYWVRIGLIEPTQAPRGSGYARLFDEQAVARARAIVALLRAGVALHVITSRVNQGWALGLIARSVAADCMEVAEMLGRSEEVRDGMSAVR